MQFSADIDQRINENVDPCDDFYGYSCFNPTAENGTSSLLASSIQKQIQNRLKAGLQFGDGEAVKKYFDLYNKCKALNTEKNFKQTLMDYVHVFDALKADDYNQKIDSSQLAKIMAYTLVYHDFSMISWLDKTKCPHKRFSDFGHLLAFEAPHVLSHYIDDYRHPEKADGIKNAFRERYALVDSTLEAGDLTKTASEMYDLEMKIVNVMPTLPIASQIKVVQTLTVKEAMTALPKFNWGIFVTSLAAYGEVDLLNGTNLDDYPLMFDELNRTKAILDIISNTPAELFRNYIKTRIVLHLKTVLQNDCEALTTSTLPLVKQYLYITDSYPTAAERNNFKNSATKTVDNIIASVRKMLEAIPWIKNDSKTYAGFTAKIDKMKKLIGYPDGLDDQTKLDQLHADFVLSADESLSSLFAKCSKFLAKSLLDDRVKRMLDVTYSFPQNDFFSNRIVVPMGALQTYSPNYVTAAIYGGIGAVIGHEIMHGFDDSGFQVDSDGYINPWMSNSSQVHFNSMVQCVIDEYNTFDFTDSKGKAIKINGILTAGENVADHGGLRAAYNAFLGDPEWNRTFPRTLKLKNTTNEQLFFLAYNRGFCDPYGDAVSAAFDMYSPKRVRVFGTLREFEPFRKAFNCPDTSKYAPEKQCWHAASGAQKSDVYSVVSSIAASILLSVFLILIV
uniref:Peptidase_M13 domain-containing protein n=1 Tax=Panagrellus redivivus TaxID=6233 RepID=A0A7E4VQP3_PANRE